MDRAVIEVEGIRTKAVAGVASRHKDTAMTARRSSDVIVDVLFRGVGAFCFRGSRNQSDLPDSSQSKEQLICPLYT